MERFFETTICANSWAEPAVYNENSTKPEVYICSYSFWPASEISIVHAHIVAFCSEVERELGMLFSKAGKWSSSTGSQSKQSRSGTKFQMLVEDVREGVLVGFSSHFLSFPPHT